jgi:LPXTG-motif cell wall-anchored protein
VEVETSHFSTFAVFEVAGDQTEIAASAPKTLDGKELPNTATNNGNLLFAGLLLVLLGSVLVFVKMRRLA